MSRFSFIIEKLGIDRLEQLSGKKKLMLITIPILLLGLGVTLYLIQNPQIFRSRASINPSSAFEIYDNLGNSIHCEGTRCPTNGDSVNIRLKDIAPLLQ